MGNIVLLDELTINKIAAGEVIERPANVVKELVENSIDAGATNVVIEVKNGGKTFIRVSDNGKGIELDDMQVAIERHATSKIRKIEDLENTYTMGFRGEALASIVAISRTTLQTKTANMEAAMQMIIEAGNIIGAEETAGKVGTTITVENLFFNTPVRYKFLKQDATEFKYIKELVQKIALANTNVAIKLINDGKNVFQTNGNGEIKDIVYNLYGKEIKENLVDVNYEHENIKVTGVVGNTLMANETRKNQIVFLNKRNIKNPIITNSADQAFKGGAGIGKYGFFILNIEMPADMYDVNVHPTKMEVRFKDEQQLYKVVYHAIKGALLNKDFLGNNENENNKEEYIDNEFKFLTNYMNPNNDSVVFTQNAPKIALINRDKTRNIEYKYIGIIYKTYIIIQIENELFLVDQHAAHERVLYEQIKDNYKKNIKNNSQMMLVPEVVSLTNKEMEFVQNNITLFQNYGFDIETFGDNEIKINGIPDLEYKIKIDTKNIFMDILDEMITKERTTIKDIEERFIATVACKAAVKAGMVLNQTEVKKLLDKLFSLKNPYTCPHGRPTTVKLASFDEKSIKNC
jgi:DNA mismatch repair protein MutL